MGNNMSIYSPHPSIAYAQAGLRTIEEKTGRSIDEWVKYINKNGPKTQSERKQWLKEEFDLGTNQARWLAEYSSGGSNDWFDEKSYLRMAEGYVETMYAGKKEALRPLYDKLLNVSLAIGKEATASPCATMVPIYRNHVIAQIKPSTNSRIDMGFALGDLKPTGRLIDTGGYAKKDRITHRIAISTLSDIDNEVKLWLKKAYDRDSK
jgi:hypothetical protein